ncbi:lactosylceramide 4-alpha-galactosyltransferase-like [Contarinia nasturtii]|uniref:lactosylceramide 4-alpha-galactosyltransferase-like n=1 Tax=Contarinia nasturtii TaxID=265458 RepID=UPI0012D48356|nr:lactosylceramide 4-alpha-galactosyltransferase-like [Contarinia nasturtii]
MYNCDRHFYLTLFFIEFVFNFSLCYLVINFVLKFIETNSWDYCSDTLFTHILLVSVVIQFNTKMGLLLDKSAPYADRHRQSFFRRFEYFKLGTKQVSVRYGRIFFMILFIILVYWIFMSLFSDDKTTNCYKYPFDGAISSALSSITYFKDILDAKKQPTSGKAIFFHETSCHPNGIAKLNAKQACAIESAAHLNPNRDIFVIFASPVGINDYENLPPYIDMLWKYENIHFRNIDLWRYSKDTPGEAWINTNKLFQSNYLYEHMSDYLRVLTLYKFGGFYLDLDVVVQKNFDDLGEDFVVDDWSTVLATSIMHLNNDGIGWEIATEYLERLTKNFDGNVFIANGPKILTQTCADICDTEQRSLWTREKCVGLDLKRKQQFHPIQWRDYMMYFDVDKLNKTLELSKNSTMIHVWNDRSSHISNKVGTNNAYQVIAAKNCPSVYASSEYF